MLTEPCSCLSFSSSGFFQPSPSPCSGPDPSFLFFARGLPPLALTLTYTIPAEVRKVLKRYLEARVVLVSLRVIFLLALTPAFVPLASTIAEAATLSRKGGNGTRGWKD
jgi:hypothetical protein